MSDVLKLQYGALATMPVAITNGQFLVARDVQKAFVDIGNSRIPLCDVVLDKTEAQIKAIPKANALPKIYMSSDTLTLFYFDTTAGEEDPETHVKPGAWKQVGGTVESAEKDGAGNVITTTYKTIASATEDYNALVAMIGQINSFEVQIVASKEALPNPGDPHVLYFVPQTVTGTENVYDEYMWVIITPAHDDAPAVYGYENVGTSQADFTNYYTKTEVNSIENAVYAALGFTKSEAAASGFESVDARLTALETDGTDAAAIAEIQAQLGAYPASTDTDFVSVAARFASNESDISTLETAVGDATNPDSASLRGRMATEEAATSRFDAELGTLDSTATGYVTVADRLSAEESATSRFDAELGTLDSTAPGYQTVAARLTATEAADAELAAELGNLDSTATGYVTVADRLTALESDSTDATAIAELEAKFGAYPASTDTDFVSVAARFTADESDISTLQTEVGALQTEVGAASNPDAASLRGRMAAEEEATSRLDAELGTLDSTATGYVPVAGRLTALETEDTELNAKLGNMKASTDTGFVSVEDRLVALETDGTDAAAITEINAKLGNMKDSTDTGFVSVEARLSAEETATSRLDAELGTLDSTATGYQTVAQRLTALENADTAFDTRLDGDEDDISTLQAQIGADYPLPTDTGFKSVNTRINDLVTSIGNINKFDIVVIRSGESLPATGALYTIYFVPIAAGADDNDGHTKYTEYMWVADATLTAGGYYEEIGITEADLDEYYTKTEVDTIIGTDSTANTVKGRIKANENAITRLDAELGTLDSTATGYQTVAARLTAEESATSRLDAELGTLDSTATGYIPVAGRLTALENADTSFAAQMGNYASPSDTGFVSVEDRFTADEAAIAEINAKLGNMKDSTDTGFASVEARLTAIEAGALNQNEDLDNANKPVLVSGDNNHNTVEYVSNVTVNASTGTVTANALVLGGATVTYNSTTGALEINF